MTPITGPPGNLIAVLVNNFAVCCPLNGSRCLRAQLSLGEKGAALGIFAVFVKRVEMAVWTLAPEGKLRQSGFPTSQLESDSAVSASSLIVPHDKTAECSDGFLHSTRRTNRVSIRNFACQKRSLIKWPYEIRGRLRNVSLVTVGLSGLLRVECLRLSAMPRMQCKKYSSTCVAMHRGLIHRGSHRRPLLSR